MTQRYQKFLEMEAEIARQAAHAKATDGCPMCFKPFDPEDVSCNRPECLTRWKEIRKARRKEAMGIATPSAGDATA